MTIPKTRKNIIVRIDPEIKNSCKILSIPSLVISPVKSILHGGKLLSK